MATNFYVDLPPSGGSSGVSSLNSLTGAITLTGSGGITLTPTGNTIDISGSGGGGSPGGSNHDVQYNSSGSFAGSDNFQFDGTNITFSGVFLDATAATSIDPFDRQLFDSSGSGVVLWNAYNLLANIGAGYQVSVDWGNTFLANLHGKSLDWTLDQLYIPGGGGGTITVLDWGNQTLLDSASILSVDWQNHQLTANDGFNIPYVSLDWGQFTLSDPSSHDVVLSWSSLQLIDNTTSNISVDWADRLLVDNTGTTTLDWQNTRLISNVGSATWGGVNNGLFGIGPASGGASQFLLYEDPSSTTVITRFDQINNILMMSNNVNPAGTFDFAGKAQWRVSMGDSNAVSSNAFTIQVAGAGQSFNTQSLTPFKIDGGTGNIQIPYVISDAAALSSIDPTNRLLIHPSGQESMDWDNGFLLDNGGVLSVDWQDRHLLDVSADVSIDWGARFLTSNTSAIVLDWNDGIPKLSQISTPGSSPSSGTDYLYFKSDDNLYKMNSAGVEVEVGGSPGGSNGQFQFNNSGSLAGEPNLFDASGRILIGGASDDSSSPLQVLGNLNLNGSLVDSALTPSVQPYSRLLLDNSNNNSLDWANRILSDGAQNSLSYGSRQLYAADGSVALAWNLSGEIDIAGILTAYPGGPGQPIVNLVQGVLVDNSNAVALTWVSRILYDNTGTTSSVDWANRLLLASDGTTNMNWSTAGDVIFNNNITIPGQIFGSVGSPSLEPAVGLLIDGSAFQTNSLDWTSRLLYYPDGVTTAMTWAGNVSISDNAGLQCFNASDRYLIDNTNVVAIDWQNRILNDSSGAISLNWTNRSFVDSTAVNAIDYNNRDLFDGSGTSVLNWNSTGVLHYNVTSTGIGTALILDGGNQILPLTSSARFKEEVREERSFAGANLKAANYHRKGSETSTRETGLIAEEAYEVIPEIVNLDNEGKPYSINMNAAIAVLFDKVAELEKKLTEANEQLAKLKPTHLRRI